MNIDTINLKPIQIANKLKELTGINVFKYTRKKEYVEVRALLAYLLRNKLNMRWKYIAQFYIDNGLKYDHSKAIHSCKTYKELSRLNPNLKEMEQMFTFNSDLTYDQIDKCYYLEHKVESLNKKIIKLKKELDTPMYNIVKDLDEIYIDEVEERLEIWKKSLEWKKNLK